MRSIDRLEQQRRMKRQKQNLPPPDEETEEEMEPPKFVPLNRMQSAFGGVDGAKGLNTAPSVFDAQAVFHTEQGGNLF